MHKANSASFLHPGSYLADEMSKRDLTQTALSQILEKPLKTVNEIVNGKKSVTPETALLLEAALEISADIWLSLQKSYDLAIAQDKHKTKYKQVEKRAKLHFRKHIELAE